QSLHGFNERKWQPGGFHRHLAACQRQWQTKTGKANFIRPQGLEEDLGQAGEDTGILQLITLRSNDQFNTTIYSYHDRFRGIYGTRMVVLMHRNDIDRLELREGDKVRLVTEADDGIPRQLGGLNVVAYDIPEGCCAGYYPECNVLIPLWHHAERSKVPAAKSVPVRVVRDNSVLAEHPAETPVSSDLIAGSPLSDVATDLTRAAGVTGRLALRGMRQAPPKAIAIA